MTMMLHFDLHFRNCIKGIQPRPCGTTLGSLSRLVQSLPRMIIKDETGKQVKFSLEAAKLAQNNASQGICDASAVSSRHARSLAEDEFFHPFVMSISYYPFEHMFAVYSRITDQRTELRIKVKLRLNFSLRITQKSTRFRYINSESHIYANSANGQTNYVKQMNYVQFCAQFSC